jgi:phage recombination protein Bet
VTEAIVATVDHAHALAPVVPEDKKDLLRRTIAKGTSPGEFDLFVNVCNMRRLNPFTKQIHPVVREEWNPTTRQREPKMVIQTGIDGFRVIAERTGEFEGEGDYQWCGEDMVWLDVWLGDEPPAAARATVYRKGRRPTTMIARWGAYAPYKKDGELMSMWKQRGPEQLVKCAVALAYRAAFPEDTSGLYTDDEMAQADNNRPQVQATATQHKQLSAPAADRKSTPPPAAEPPMFAKTFPNRAYADKPLAACADLEVLKDYKCWLEAQLGDERKARKAQAALDALAGEFDRRIEAEAAVDPIIQGLEDAVQRKREERGEGAESYLDGDQ